jgi:hypothetical protein
VLLAVPSIPTGRGSDDFVLTATQRHSAIALGRAPFDLFAFATGDLADATRMRDVGVFPWWTDSASRLHFFRPLASLSHVLDDTLWADSPGLEHAHNLGWYAAAIAMLWLVLRRLNTSRWPATFALLLYAVDHGHGGAVGWISNRNGLMAATFGFATLWAHDRWRRGGGASAALLAPLCFLLALSSGEAGVATVGYLLAYSMFVEEKDRIRPLLPYAVIVAGFAAIYALGSFGAVHTTQYIDPVREPLRFAGAMATRLPIYLQTTIGGPASDGWIVYPMVHPILPYVMWMVSVALLCGFLWLAWPVIRADRENRFWLVGSALATVPACAGFPSDRLLLIGGAGAIVFVARFIIAVARDDGTLYRSRRTRRIANIAAVWLLIHGVAVNAIAFSVRAGSGGAIQKVFAMCDRSLPSDPKLVDRTTILVNAPLQPMVYYSLYARAADGRPRPDRTRLLATGSTELAIARLDRHTVRLSSDRGLLSRDVDMMMRAPDRDLLPGTTVAVDGMQVFVDEVTADGRPAVVRFRFDQDLDDPRLLWLQWGSDGFAPFALPAVGQVVTLPPVRLFELFTR